MELQALLAPISEHSPCGEDMSFSFEFDQIANMRREDDPTLDQGAWVTTLKVADWPGVAQACTDLLSRRTKDLRLGMWLTEAWALTQGYDGLDQGLRLCAQLCERYWDGLYPQADSGDHEERIGNMSWLLQRLVGLADSLPVTQGRQGAAYNLRELATARQLQPLIERAPNEAAQLTGDKITLDQFNRALRETPAKTLLTRLAAARECMQHLLNWQVLVDGHLGANGPGFVQAKEALGQAVHELERLARDTGVLSLTSGDKGQGPAAASTEDEHGADMTAAASAPAVGAPPRTRAQALQQLRDVAGFFRRTEPHSPVAYLAEKAVKWGEMPLHEWLSKVIKDPGAMSHLQELLGLDDLGDNSQQH